MMDVFWMRFLEDMHILLSRHLGANNLVLEPSWLLTLHFNHQTVSVQNTARYKKGQKTYQRRQRKTPS